MRDSMRRVFLSHSRSARQLSGSQTVAGAHVQAIKWETQTTTHKLKTRWTCRQQRLTVHMNSRD